MKPKNTICLWFDKDAEEAARFYAATFPDSKVTAVHKAPGDYPSGKAGDVLTIALDRRVRVLKVLQFVQRRGDAELARTLYDELSAAATQAPANAPQTMTGFNFSTW